MENKRTETNKTVQKRLEPELKLINMDTVEVEQIEWLLYPFIPYGKVTIIQGDPGEGKTTMVLQIIAKLTKGETILPADSTKDKRIDIDSESDMVDAENIENNASTQHLEAPVNVIYQTAEDGLGDTIKPRLLAAGADCTKVMVIDDSEQPLTMADVRLEEAIVQTKARMVVLDPIQGFLGAEVDMHRANEIRPLMKRIAILAEKYHCAIILIGHMNKNSNGKSSYRGLGSIDFQAAARSVLIDIVDFPVPLIAYFILSLPSVISNSPFSMLLQFFIFNCIIYPPLILFSFQSPELNSTSFSQSILPSSLQKLLENSLTSLLAALL